MHRTGLLLSLFAVVFSLVSSEDECVLQTTPCQDLQTWKEYSLCIVRQNSVSMLVQCVGFGQNPLRQTLVDYTYQGAISDGNPQSVKVASRAILQNASQKCSDCYVRAVIDHCPDSNDNFASCLCHYDVHNTDICCLSTCLEVQNQEYSLDEYCPFDPSSTATESTPVSDFDSVDCSNPGFASSWPPDAITATISSIMSEDVSYESSAPTSTPVTIIGTSKNATSPRWTPWKTPQSTTPTNSAPPSTSPTSSAPTSTTPTTSASRPTQTPTSASTKRAETGFGRLTALMSVVIFAYLGSL